MQAQFPAPGGRLIAQQSTLSDPKGLTRLETDLKTHAINTQLQIIVPQTNGSTSLLKELGLDKLYYYEADVPVVSLLDSQFLEQFSEGDLTAFSGESKGDRHNTLAIVHDHVLLKVDKETYEELGLIGQESKLQGGTGRWWTVDVDMWDREDQGGGKGERVKRRKLLDSSKKSGRRLDWCLRDRVPDAKMYLTRAANQGNMHFPPGTQGVRKDVQIVHHQWPHVPVLNPCVEEVEGDQNNDKIRERLQDNWGTLYHCILDYVGAAACGALATPRGVEMCIDGGVISPHDCMEHEDSDGEGRNTPMQTGIECLQAYGVVHAEIVRDVVINRLRDAVTQGIVPWAAVTVWGHADAPVSWKTRDHSFSMTGENDYTVLLKPDGGYYMLAVVNSHDEHS